jgi:hypothetical protein
MSPDHDGDQRAAEAGQFDAGQAWTNAADALRASIQRAVGPTWSES